MSSEIWLTSVMTSAVLGSLPATANIVLDIWKSLKKSKGKPSERPPLELVLPEKADGAVEPSAPSPADSDNVKLFEIEPLRAVGKFIGTNKGFVQQIKNIQHLITRYCLRDKVLRPLNIGIVASPGSGKSFLIKQLCSKLDSENTSTNLLKFNIASMQDISQLWSSFREIAHNSRDKVPTAFYDEVDAPLSGESVYAKLLMPMADGEYYDDNAVRSIGKSVLFFAASSPWGKKPPEQGQAFHDWRSDILGEIREFEDEANPKAKDFIDRIDDWLLIPPLTIELAGTKDLEKERQALIILLIQRHFPKVEEFDLKSIHVLSVLIKIGTRVRRIEQAIFASNVGNSSEFLWNMLPRQFRDSIDEELLELDYPEEEMLTKRFRVPDQKDKT